TQRRWLAMCNGELSELITERIGDGWTTDLMQLRQLEEFVDDPDFRGRWHEIKQTKKAQLAKLIQQECKIQLPTDAIYDVQVKRIHEYKRQLLNALHLIHLYDRIKSGRTEGLVPRVAIFGGKAAPGYHMAKQIIKLINNVGDVINNDSDVGDLLKVVFIPNYRVSAAEVIVPGTDLSEQISTAGKEASGTGNMKFMLNGAMTIGTLDGANIEIREEVGDEYFFLFGLTAKEVEHQRKHYNPQAIIDADEDLKRVIQLLECGHFNQVEPGIFDDTLASLTTWGDYWMTCADFRSYINAQAQAAAAYQDQDWWLRASIINSARAGKFSSDRTIRQYNEDIWKLKPIDPFPVA
ncbi:MAG: glycogen/starch/alpha-glucan phosphorylase, partial [Planctomycetota bacterium]